MNQRNLLQQLIAIVLLIGIAAGTPTAQTARKVNKTPPVKAGWSGVITYQKTLQETFNSDDQLFGSLNKEERVKHDETRSYRYEGRLIVNDLAGTGRPTTMAKMAVTDSRSHKVTQTEFTRCHAFDPDRIITAKTTDREYTDGKGSGEAYTYYLSVSGDTFRLNFLLPEFSAGFIKDWTSSYANLCPDSTRKGESTSKESVVKVERAGGEVEGEIDPNNPDVLQGSKTWTTGETSTSKGWTHTVTWKLRRKPQPLMIVDLKFSQPIYPSPNDWHEIEENSWAVDGNQVKVVATVANFGSTDKTATVNFKELRENADLPNGPGGVTVPANSQKEVELIWDTSGYAWRESGADVVPEMNRQVEARIPDDSLEKDLTVHPKPVVVIWGLWQNADAMKKFRDSFKAVSEKWVVRWGQTDTRKVSTDNADELDQKVREVQKSQNAWHVDLVGLMNGGLVGRVYVHSKMPTQFDGKPTATHLVMMSVPNLGTPCAVGIFGLSFRLNTLNLDAVAELSPQSMKKFNLLVNNTNGTRFAALAGDTRSNTCQSDVHGDGFTPVPSAIWRTKVNAISRARVHTRDLMGEVAHFRQVYKWLAIPPKGDHTPDPGTLAANFSNQNLIDPREAAFGKTRNYGAMFAPESPVDDADPIPDFAKALKVEAGKPVEIEIPVRSGSQFSLNLFAPSNVSATLFDEQGRIVGTNVAGSEESLDIFRTINVKGPFQAGKWKLRLESTEKAPTEVAITTFVDFVSGMFTAK
ncbi:MAG: hypothetical protein DMF63_01610 [Acidobacteria bacterium]|nr:MAG: hypothetical protein DMF63_01610 [Acidobacteriota bacterium]